MSKRVATITMSSLQKRLQHNVKGGAAAVTGINVGKHPQNGQRSHETNNKPPPPREASSSSSVDENETSNQKQKHHNHPKPHRKRTRHFPLKIMTESFQDLVKDSQAVRYKVHSPECSCAKVANVWKKEAENNREFKRRPPLNGFVVLPDVKNVQSIFVSGINTATRRSYLLEPLKLEARLREQIFSKNHGAAQKEMKENISASTSNNMKESKDEEKGKEKVNTQNIKISCAHCMLDVEPNGFLCISSTDRKIVDRARDLAREARRARVKKGETLHHDHADEVCTLEKQVLHHIIQGKSNQKDLEIKDDHVLIQLRKHLKDQNVNVQMGDSDEAKDDPTVIILGHHLKTVLDIIKKKEGYNFIFTMIRESFKKGRHTIEIDLPGGKRHLGEDSFDCAVRETVEETSLKIDRSWLVVGEEGVPMKSRSKFESGNVFYLAQPPSSVGNISKLVTGGKKHENDDFRDILDSVFWTNTGI